MSSRDGGGKLRIGLSSCFFHADPARPIFKGKTLVYAEQSLIHWIMSEGALAYLIPPPAATSPVALADLAQELDGLVLQGGSDVSPRSYGEEPLRPEWSGDGVRDAYETQLLREFMSQGKPVLGVCRGAQLINVAFGGALYQDIATQLPQARCHRDWEIYDQIFHRIAIDADSRLSRLYPQAPIGKVNTIHHQAIRELGRELRVDAICLDDGLIEAIRLKDPRQYVFGVQWHPEFQDPGDPSLLPARPILVDFLKEAQLRRC